MNIILIGFKSSGKSSFGEFLSKELRLPFIDIDSKIEELYFHKAKVFLPFREIYEKLGDAGFRNLEREAVALLKNVQNSIIATGGGTILDTENLKILKSIGKLVYLKTDRNEAFEKISSGAIPLFLDSNNFEESFNLMYSRRSMHYESIADYILDCSWSAHSDV